MAYLAEGLLILPGRITWLIGIHVTVMWLICIFLVSLWLPGDWVLAGSLPQDKPVVQLNQDLNSPHYGTIEVTGLATGVLSALSSIVLTAQGWQALSPVFTGGNISKTTDHPGSSGPIPWAPTSSGSHLVSH